MFVKARYFCSIKLNTNWYWDQHPQHHVITVPTRTILNPWLEVNTITDIHDIPKIVCNRTQAKQVNIKTSYMSYWFWLRLYLRRNLYSIQNWVWKRCRSSMAMTKKIKMKISNEYYIYLLYIYILTITRYFYLFLFFCVILVFSSILACIV